MFMTPHLDSYSKTDPKPEILSAVKTRKRISHDGRNVCGITHCCICNILTPPNIALWSAWPPRQAFSAAGSLIVERRNLF